MFTKSLKLALFLSFLMLMGQQACQTTTPSSGRSSGGRTAQPTSWNGQSFPQEGNISCVNPTTPFACMMCNCAREAGTQSPAGKEAVGKVVMTRVRMDSYPGSPCRVIKAKSRGVCAFSWFCKRDKYRPVKGAEYRSCYQPTLNALNFQGHFASHYHACYVKPRWRHDCQTFPGGQTRTPCNVRSGQGGRLEDHVFYPVCDVRNLAPGERATSVVKLFGIGEENELFCKN